MTYEAVLLFGVLFCANWLFDFITQSQGASASVRHWRQAWLFLVMGGYFSFCWHRSGQTLAMKTWRVKVIDKTGKRLAWSRALLRYLYSWIWLMPVVLAHQLLKLSAQSTLVLFAVLSAATVLSMFIDKHRRYLHDRLAGTKLITVPKTLR